MAATVEAPMPTEAEALDAYSRIVVEVAERLAPSVANLRITRRGRGGRMPAGAGSAVVLTPDGFLLTSAHVVAGPGRGGRAAFVDGRELSFRIVGVDRLSDLALLRAAARSRRRAGRASESHRVRAPRRGRAADHRRESRGSARRRRASC